MPQGILHNLSEVPSPAFRGNMEESVLRTGQGWCKTYTCTILCYHVYTIRIFYFHFKGIVFIFRNGVRLLSVAFVM